jgi:prolyl-tRNA editing enzyme YbaK/EbsC (Cys-tRNA(Pro) deacylase)
MAGANERFLEAVAGMGLVPDIRRFPEGTKTADDAARAIGCDVAQIVKSLVFIADDHPVLALTSGRHRVDPDALATLCGASWARRATPEEARAATGFGVGGTPPFGHPGTIRTLVDETLLRFDQVWAAAGTPDSVFPVEPGVLLRLSGGAAASFAETPPER